MHLSPKTRSFFPLPSLGFLHTNRLAGLPQTPKSFSGNLRDSRKHFEEVSGLCSVSAKVLFTILAFAGLLQERFFPFWSLQDSCKDAFPHFGVCRTSARTLFLILAFAELLQERFFPFWRLQDFCKSAFSHFGVCRTSARTHFSILVFAELLQGRFSPFWCLQDFCKDAFLYFGVCHTLPLHASQISGDPRAHRCRSVGEIRLFLPIFY